MTAGSCTSAWRPPKSPFPSLKTFHIGCFYFPLPFLTPVHPCAQISGHILPRGGCWLLAGDLSSSARNMEGRLSQKTRQSSAPRLIASDFLSRTCSLALPGRGHGGRQCGWGFRPESSQLSSSERKEKQAVTLPYCNIQLRAPRWAAHLCWGSWSCTLQPYQPC